MSGRIPNIPNRAQGRPFAGANPEGQAPNLHVNVGNQANQPPLAAVNEAAAQPARNPRSSAGQRRPNRLQEAQARLQQLEQAVRTANTAVLHADNQSSQMEEISRARQLIQPYTSLIDAVDALDGASPAKRKELVNQRDFANVFIARYECRTLIRHGDGTNEAMLRLMVVNSESSDPFQVRQDATHRDAVVSQCNKACLLALENAADLRRAFELAPELKQLKKEDLGGNTGTANIIRVALTFMSTQRLQHQATDLETLTGDVAGQLVRQSQLLESTINPFIRHYDALLSDEWVMHMRPIAADIASICLDLAACAVDITLPEPDANHCADYIDRVRSNLDETVRNCLDLTDQMKLWQADHPAPTLNRSSGIEAPCSTARAGDFVSVLAPTGLHVPAQLQDDGTARTLGPDAEVFGRRSSTDVEFHLIDDSDTDSDSDIGVDAPPKRSDPRATKTLQKGADLLALDIEKEFRAVTTGKGYTNPDILRPSYQFYAEKWQKMAKDMRALATKLENQIPHVQNVSEEQKLAAPALAADLVKRAEILAAKAQELVRPETAWSLIKAYARPQASQWAELLANGQISQVGKVIELASTPAGTLFEVCIQPQPDEYETTYPPVWLHLHAKQPMKPAQVAKAGFDRFDAVHLKADVDKNRGPQWVETQRAKGNYNIDVHRSPVNADLLKALMKRSGKKAEPILRTSS